MRPALYNPYTPVHAAVAAAILLWATFAKGFAFFWHEFVYGGDALKSPAVVLLITALTVFLFGGIAVFCWISTLVARAWRGGGDAPPPPPDRRRALRLTLVSLPGVIAAALVLAWLGALAVGFCTGTEPAQQDVLRFLSSGSGSRAARVGVVALLVVQAPFVEEPLFRGVVFRGCLKAMPPWAAMAASGFLFALVHANAGAFMGLWYVGVAFAWLYWRTGTILAPILAHLAFNLVNLALAFVLG